MSYSTLLGALGDTDPSDLPAGVAATALSAKCTDFLSWKAAQLACNEADIDSVACHQALIRSCPRADYACPDGQSLISDAVTLRAPFGPNKGKWSTGTYHYCASSYAPAAAAAGAATRNWGLLIGLGLAAVVVYKVAF